MSRGRAASLLSVVFLSVASPPPRALCFLNVTVEKEYPIYCLQEMGFIHDLWVDEEYRNEGAGRQLVTVAVERFRAIGVEQVRCDTAWANEVARNLLKTCGLRPSVVEMLMEL